MQVFISLKRYLRQWGGEAAQSAFRDLQQNQRNKEEANNNDFEKDFAAQFIGNAAYSSYAPDQSESATLWILNDEDRAVGFGHNALALQYSKGFIYFTVTGDPDETITEGGVTRKRASTVLTEEGETVEGYDLGDDEQAFKFIDKHYSRRFSIDVSLDKGMQVINYANAFAHAGTYSMFNSNCADAISYGLRREGIYMNQWKVFGIAIPNYVYERTMCDMGKECMPSPAMTPQGYKYKPWIDQ